MLDWDVSDPLRFKTLSHRCEIHARKMDEEGYYTTANVLWEASDALVAPTGTIKDQRQLDLDLRRLEARLDRRQRKFAMDLEPEDYKVFQALMANLGPGST